MHRLSPYALLVVAVLTLTQCSSEKPFEPPDPGTPTLPTDTVASLSALGAQWTELPTSPSAPGHFQDASFITPDEGWVVDIGGGVFHTSDAGATWQALQASGASGSGFYRSVLFVSPTVGWIGDLNNFNNPQPGRALWETRDGGKTFTNISARIIGPAPAGICGLWSVDPLTVFGVGRWNGPAVFIKTTDGGLTWQSTSLAPMMTGAVDVYFFDKLHGVIAGGRGVGNSAAEQLSSVTVIATTDDGGATWTERYAGTAKGQWAWKISFPTSRVGYIAIQALASPRVVLKTTDGGITWSELVVGGKEGGFSGAGFVSASTGWVGGDGYAYETTDGGETWKRSSWAKGQSINRFRIFPSGIAYAVGQRVFKWRPPA